MAGIAGRALAARLPRAAFSTAPSRRAAAGPTPGKNNGVSSKHDDNNNDNNNKSGEGSVEVPVFNLGHITSSPRGRFWLRAGLCVLASVEMYGWYNFGPKLLGRDKEEERG
ncbi:hypothetical protein LX36DRAFT_663610 [Colletotrichum falcatum]|nr:hypothetical protein LX36DRAFT_663610 [Colletotrichum falcatum]